ncbi:uncharacterized protein [Rutidosis leptorrhynchoides]|uniref:uncharacterized protein n=1 Tax=Rutidosis leptorrhynchoides TaxID=125765 RepID=UPI003A99B801
MAAFKLTPTIPYHKCISGINNNVSSPTKLGLISERRMKVTCQAANITSADPVSVMDRRKLMKLLLFGAVGLPAAGILVPFFVQPSSGSFGGGIAATDEFGNDIIASEWLGPGDRSLTRGLNGDPTYLMVENNRTLATYGINAVCTHLGCIVPWNTVKKKFMCPCHGSQYDNDGRVLSGPASLPLELAHVDIDDDKVVCTPWTETDFRTGDVPWWS